MFEGRTSGAGKIFERRVQYNHNQICLAENFFQVVKKDLHLESVLVCSIFLPKNIVIFKKKVFTLNLSRFCQFFVEKHSGLYEKGFHFESISLISHISDLQARAHAQWLPPMNALLGRTNISNVNSCLKRPGKPKKVFTLIYDITL